MRRAIFAAVASLSVVLVAYAQQGTLPPPNPPTPSSFMHPSTAIPQPSPTT